VNFGSLPPPASYSDWEMPSSPGYCGRWLDWPYSKM
jgi:hypothetical protein